MTYVDGYVVPVPKDRLAEYKELATVAARVWKGHGALSYVECVADDVAWGKQTSFPRAVELKEDEVVILAWITFPSKEARDAINARAMSDPRLKCDPENTPFDAMRMFWGGFTPLVEA